MFALLLPLLRDQNKESEILKSAFGFFNFSRMSCKTICSKLGHENPDRPTYSLVFEWNSFELIWDIVALKLTGPLHSLADWTNLPTSLCLSELTEL